VALPFRAKQLIVSLVGAVLFVPRDLFFGEAFAFSFGAQSSPWAWAFDLTAFWGQLLGILISFFKPRLGGACILATIIASIAIRLSVQVAVIYGPARWSAAMWLNAAPGLLKTAALFWGGPLVLALLLLRRARAVEREPASAEAQH
jgi:hypothetical protein